jgi:hypothetical protein
MTEENENLEQDSEVTRVAFSFDEEEIDNVVEQKEIVSEQEVQQEEIEEEVVEKKELESEQEDDYEYTELNEDLALEHIAKQKGVSVEDLKELLTPKEQKKYAPQMEKFNEFIEKTGNTNYNDYLETQKDWTTEEVDVKLKSFIRLSNPSLSDKEVQRIYDKKYNTEGLDPEDDENEILDRGINTKTDSKLADEFFAKRKEEFNSVGGSDDFIPSKYREALKKIEELDLNEQEIEKDYLLKRADYESKTENLFNKGFEGFKVKLGNEEIGFEEVSFKPNNLEETKNMQLSTDNFTKKYFDEQGVLKDPIGFHKFLYMGANHEAELNKAYARGMAKQLELDDKIAKNIQPDNLRQLNDNRGTGVVYDVEKG